MTHGLEPRVHAPGSGERFAGAGGDAMMLRLETSGGDPITIVEDDSSDTEPAPLHSHPWDELIYVLEGGDVAHLWRPDRRSAARARWPRCLGACRTPCM